MNVSHATLLVRYYPVNYVLIQDNEELLEMNEQAYESEKLLQTWLVKYPELLVGNRIDGLAQKVVSGTQIMLAASPPLA